MLTLCTLMSNALAQTTWYPISSGTDRELRTIQFVNDQIGYIGGDSTLLKTTDGGQTWTAVEIDTMPFGSWQQLDIYDMHWFSAEHGIIMSGIWNGAAETFDGGVSWSAVPFAHNGFCQTTALFFFDGNTGFAGGAGCFEGHIIDRFSNGTWYETTMPQSWDPQSWVTSIEFRDSQLGLAGTNNGKLLRTTDGGLTWDTVPHLAADSAITDFIFYNDGSIRATHLSEFSYGVMLSTDDGLTWQFDSETASFFYPDMHAAHINGQGISYLGGRETNSDTNGVIFDDQGPIWFMTMIDEPVNDIASHSDSITFLVGRNGSIYANVDPLILGQAPVAQQVRLQLAPNPVHDQLQVSGLDGTIGWVRIVDVSGRDVLKPENRAIMSSIDVSHLESGTYLLSVITESGIGSQRFVKD